jgi:hypothetical protein
MLKLGMTTIGVAIALMANSAVSVAYAQDDYVSGVTDVDSFDLFSSWQCTAYDAFQTINTGIVTDFSPAPVPDSSSILAGGFALAAVAGWGTITRRREKVLDS